MSYFPDQGHGQGTGQGNVQNFNYDDGQRRMTYSTQSFTVNSSQQGTPVQAQLQLQPPTPMHPQMLPSLDYNQVHQNHMALHQASVQSAMQTTQNMMSTMQASMPSMIAHPPQPAQIQYIQTAPLMLQAPPAQWPMQQQPQPDMQLTAMNAERDDQRRQELIRGVHQVDQRLQRLDEGQAQIRQYQEAAYNRLAASSAREQELQRQLLEAEQRHSRDLAEMAHAHASRPQPASPGLDMAALQGIIDEVRSNSLSREDIKHFVGEAVSTQIAGVARSSDIDSAASRMEKGLNKVPASASETQIRQAVQDEIAKAVEKVAKHMAPQQRMLEEQQPRGNVAWELQNNGVGLDQAYSTAGPSGGQSYGQANSVYTLPPVMPTSTPQPAQVGYQLTPSALAALPSPSKPTRRSSKSRASVVPGDSNALVRPGHGPRQPSDFERMPVASSAAPTSMQQTTAGLTLESLSQLQLEASPGESSSKSRVSKSRASIQPGSHNALERVRHSDSPSGTNSKKSTVSVQASEANAMVPPGAREPSEPARASKQSTVSVQPSSSNAMVRPSSQEPGGLRRSSKQSTVSIQPSVSYDTYEPRTTSKVSKASIQPSSSNAMVRPAGGDVQQPHSSAEVMALAQSQGGQLSEFGGHRGIPELPDDFPDNASQVTAWERGQAARRPVEDRSTGSTVRPKNDRRGDVGPSPLRQLAGVQEEGEGGTAMVRQSRELSKQSRR
ncbi:hypothetical protein LTR37_017102 [Vermiconidia calcicola]|uniref:Uncharacterized protein n=1 Tax=Vermiconidia calcicola TaxID=1690605 RepID=A0ACC3MLD1_9PEZI|nr:hypothetical protein LTR37_017102 [Vermiconidia calcicola]